MFNPEDLEKIKIHLANTPGDRMDDWHQSILCVGYHWWQKCEGQPNYDEMISWVSDNFGELPALLILLGKYNHQVCNGGHHQYYDNGFTSTGKNAGGCFQDHNGDLSLHERMLELMKQFGLHEHEIGSKVFQNASKLEMYSDKTCDCAGGYWDDADECDASELGPNCTEDECNCEDEWFESDEECDCPEAWLMADQDTLDGTYYTFNDAWVATIEAGLVEVFGDFPKQVEAS